jgi:IS30 family transposase
MRSLGHSIDKIAVELGRSKSTICRELKRNCGADGYKPDQADRIAWARKLRGHLLERHSQLRACIVARLGMGWTPEQISGRLRLEGSQHRLSPESIYRYVYSPHGRKDKLHRYLAQRKAKRGYRRRKGRTSRMDEAKQPIWLRPTKAHTRAEVGHWEGDCMHFRNQSDILLTLQDRKTRYWMMSKLPRKDADTTADTIRFQLEGLPEKTRKTITLDNGSEFARHHRLEQEIGLRAFFCEPHSPWQRGSIENGNGRVRRDLPRKTDLQNWTDDDIETLTFILNSTPRKCLGYRTPIEAFANEIGVALEL